MARLHAWDASSYRRDLSKRQPYQRVPCHKL